MRAKELFESSITLRALYGDNLPDRDERFWDEIRTNELEIPLQIKTLPSYKIEILLRDQYRVEHLDELLDLLDTDQRSVLERYRADPRLSQSIIVLSGDRIIDGNHRALAAALNRVSIRYVDLADLEEQDVVENDDTINSNSNSELSPQLQRLIELSERAGAKMSSSRILRYQLHVPRKVNIDEDWKPNAELWTSTAEFRGNNSYTSAWAEWCYYNMPEWLAKTGVLYEIQPGARILNIGSDAAAKKIAAILGHQFTQGKYEILSSYPWNQLAQHFDAIRYPARLKNTYRSRSSNILMSLWDVESTAWFNTDKLKLLDYVTVKTREW